MKAVSRFEIPSVILHCPHLSRDIGQLLYKIPSPVIMTGLPTTPGEAGCLLMHQEAVRMARAAGLPWIMVMEDDCLLTEHFDLERLKWQATWARENGYGCLQGGSVLTTNPRKAGAEGLVEVERACSAHFMVYFAAGYDAVLKAEQPFDLSISDHGMRTVLTLPFIAIQRAGMSGIGMPLEQGASKTYTGPQQVNHEGLFARQQQYLMELLA